MRECPVSAQWRSVILEDACRRQYGTLRAYVTETDHAVDSSFFDSVLAYVNEAIEEQVFYFAHLIYQKMCLSGDWGDVGQSACEVSFARCLLKLAPDQNLDNEGMQRFETLVDTHLQQLCLDTKSQSECQQLFDDFRFRLFDRDFQVYEAGKINSIIRFCGSDLFFQGGVYGLEKEAILGRGTHRRVGNYDVVRLTEEVMRTPNTVVSMAAVIGDDQVFVRDESLRTIFQQKWVDFLRFGDGYAPSVFHRVSDGIKRRALTLYGVDSIPALQAIEPVFVDDLVHNMTHHELGHAIIQHHYLPVSMAALGEVSRLCGETIVMALLEVLAEFSSCRQVGGATQNTLDVGNREQEKRVENASLLSGPLEQLVAISKTDYKRATRMFFTYLSDAWFFDTLDTHMFTYSTIMCAMMSAVMAPHKPVDFKTLETMMDVPSVADVLALPESECSPLAWLIRQTMAIITDMEALLVAGRYTDEDRSIGYLDIYTKQLSEVKKEHPEIEEGSYIFYAAMWNGILENYLENEDQREAMDELLDAYRDRVLRGLFERLFGVEEIRRYEGDFEKCLADRLSML